MNEMSDLNEVQIRIKQLREILKGRDLYTPKELIRLGVYGSKSSIHIAIKKKELDVIWITERRVVIIKESIFKHVLNRMMKNHE